MTSDFGDLVLDALEQALHDRLPEPLGHIPPAQLEAAHAHRQNSHTPVGALNETRRRNTPGDSLCQAASVPDLQTGYRCGKATAHARNT
jgi:hypothetical protein